MPDLFGGSWTDEKLVRLRKYLAAYATIMRKQNFRFAYIDAFAGTGYMEREKAGAADRGLFPELAEGESKEFAEGSARIALQVEPPFDKYIFVEQALESFGELSKLKEEFPGRAERIELVNADANAWLQDRCLNYNWSRNRSVVFLDPFGMQVEWATIEAVAATEAVDLWILFPLGVAVNRLLRRDGQIDDSWRKRLDLVFGTTDWYDAFYKEKEDLFGPRSEKVINLEGIGRYYNERLKAAFKRGGVASNPLPLRNSRGNPLYLFCFAAANPRGALTAINIAQDILKS